VTRPDSAPPSPPSNGSVIDQPAESPRVVMSSDDVSRALRRVAHEILERNKGSQDLVVLGIPTRGVALARRLVRVMAEVEGHEVPCGAIDITMHRDDLRRHPIRPVEHTDIPAPGINAKTVVLVDDVLFSGRTVRAALDALSELGRPQAVRLAVLVDRGHRDLPIRADYVGKNLPTSSSERVQVRLAEHDGHDEVRISGGDR
jgi:pyrimidine operon attenuation protein/uracil phosphoribosyltransferase